MGVFKPPAPPAVQMPPPAAHPPTLGSAANALTGQTAKAKAASAEGMGSDNTVKTTPLGATAAPDTARTTLLGG